jgi:hypothetical protein
VQCRDIHENTLYREETGAVIQWLDHNPRQEYGELTKTEKRMENFGYKAVIRGENLLSANNYSLPV